MLKGGFLANAVYPVPFLRPMTDLDLLVPRNRLAEVRAVLEPWGFRMDEDYNYGHKHNASHGKYIKMITTDGSNILVEVHWDVTKRAERRAEPDIDRLWWQARPWTFDGVTALTLGPEDLILYLCLHLANEFHCFDRLLWFSDIDAILRHPTLPVDWTRFVAARADRMVTSAYVALMLCQCLLDTPVPLPVLLALRPAPWRCWLIHRLVRPEHVLHGITTRRRWAIKYLMLDSMGQLTCLLREHLLPSPLALSGAYGVPIRHSVGKARAYIWHWGVVGYRFVRRMMVSRS